ncbi:MAG: tryptophan synthase subunit alpha [Clostridiales bacterium]|jgi:tryptophan synthase alpha chain|nr:tryptophan synthase subunit alpha [Clostridiales bacterium]
MIKIKEAFKNKKAFIAYLMAGDPDLESSAKYILAAQEAGADMVEIGIPFSDPVAEGKVIQEASIRALNAGARLDKIFDMAASLKGALRIPIVFMTYLNPVFVYGYNRFFARCFEAGISGAIIPDMPFEEQGEAKAAASKYNIEIVTLIAPTSKERISKIAKGAEGFIYLVSSMGVTGTRDKITTDLDALVSEIKKVTNIPIAIGFGISTPGQAASFSKSADGVIVGSAIVNIIGKQGANAKLELSDYIGRMKAAL